MPVKGKSPVIDPMFMNACRVIQEAIPTVAIFAKLSLILLAKAKQRQAKNKKSTTKKAAPINPSSSATTAKMESEMGSGKNPNF